MQYPALAIDYQDLNRYLTASELSASAAEAHGILCAMLCSGEPGAEASWIAELLVGADETDPSTRECRRSLQDLAIRTCDDMAGTANDFTPLLPDDSLPLAERALGLYDWSRGFLYGLGLAGVDTNRLSEQAREVCDDFTAITHLDLDDLADTEANEQALTELIEFVRVAAMLVYEEHRSSVELRA